MPPVYRARLPGSKISRRLAAHHGPAYAVVMSGPNGILPAYRREAAHWARQRVQTLWEAPALEACVAGRAAPLEVLDLSCVPRQPRSSRVPHMSCQSRV